MARTFVSASTQYGRSDANPISSVEPVSAGCFFRCTSTPGSTQTFFYYGNAANGSDYLTFSLTSSGFLEIWNRAGGTIYTGTTNLCDGLWHSAFAESYDQGGAVYRWNKYRDGVQVGTVDDSGRFFHESHTRLSIGRADDSSPSQEFDGDIAEVWLAEQRVNGLEADLHSGAQTPEDAFGVNLKGRWKVLGDVSPEPDEEAGTALTLFGSPVKAGSHPFSTGRVVIIGGIVQLI